MRGRKRKFPSNFQVPFLSSSDDENAEPSESRQRLTGPQGDLELTSQQGQQEADGEHGVGEVVNEDDRVIIPDSDVEIEEHQDSPDDDGDGNGDAGDSGSPIRDQASPEPRLPWEIHAISDSDLDVRGDLGHEGNIPRHVGQNPRDERQLPEVDQDPIQLPHDDDDGGR